jgi:hypothetical protein
LDPRVLGLFYLRSSSNAEPKNYGFGHQNQELWVYLSNLKAAGPESLGSVYKARSKSFRLKRAAKLK